jgi:MoaA/NifB/PqqE/SkfB family radical SAM enzyme
MTTTTRAPEEDARHLHTPGQLSRAGVLDVGLKCAHSCRFCYYSYIDGSDDQFRGIRHGGLRSFEDCQAILAGFARQGFTHFDVTGGEPTLLPRLPELVAHARRELGLAARVITLGQFLLREKNGATLLDELLDAGLADFLFSAHAATEDDFKAFTGGSWRALESAMDALDARGFQFGANTTVFADNYRKLPDIAAALSRHGVYVQNYIFFNAYHGWRQSERAARVQARYSDAYPHLRQAVDLLTGQGVAVNIRYVPLCVVPGLERHVVGVLGLAHDPFEWRNRACNYEAAPEFCAEALEIPASGVRDCHAFHPADERLENGVRVTGMRGDRFKLFASACADCAARDACDGVDPGYLARYGDAELRPYADMALSGVLLKDRLDYAPAFALKLGGRAVMRPGAPGAERRS